jgi:hypothetical protein
MRVEYLCAVVLLVSATSVFAGNTYVVPTTTLVAQTTNNTSASNSFTAQTNGNAGAGNVSKVDVHSLLYEGATSKVYAHLLLWFGQSSHMNVGYSSTDAAQIHRQIMDMISRGIDGVIIDWYGPNTSIDQATKLVMAEAETHPGFTFAIMVDQGAIEWDSCSGCSPQEALTSQMQYIEQTYFPSPAYMKIQGRPVITNFNIDLSYTIDWNTLAAALSTQPAFLFQDDGGFTHALSDGSYSWVMPTTSDYGMSYLTSFYQTGMSFPNAQTVGASYKGFNDSLAAWGSGRVMGQQCGVTWLQTFAEINGLYNPGKQLSALQLVTWNDYEEGTEIETGISNCVSVSASVNGNELKWTIQGNGSTVDHYVPYISTDGQNLMPLGNVSAGANSLNLCSYPIPSGNYVLYLQAVGKPSVTNQISGAVKFTSSCNNAALALQASPSTVTLSPGGSGSVTITAVSQSGSSSGNIDLTCSGLPASLTCSFAPASISSSAAAGSVLTISNASVAAVNRRGKRAVPVFTTSLLGFAMFGFLFIEKGRRNRLSVIFAVCALVTMMSNTSCGGGGGISSSSSNSYSVTINGSSGSLQLSATVAVTVR